MASAETWLFGVTTLGQTVAAISQIFILGIPARLAAVWFGPTEVFLPSFLPFFLFPPPSLPLLLLLPYSVCS